MSKVDVYMDGVCEKELLEDASHGRGASANTVGSVLCERSKLIEM